MARSLTTLRLCLAGPHPADTLLARFNTALCDHNARGTFVTLLAGFIDARSGDLSYLNAGHHSSVVVASDGTVRVLPRPLGLVAGVLPDAPFEMAGTQLAAGEILVAFTDGVTEAADAEGRQFGEARVLEVLRDARPTSAQSAIDALLAAQTRFIGNAQRNDDVTLLAIRFKSGT